MQFCIVFAVIASLVAVDFVPHGDVQFPAAKIVATLLCQAMVVLVAFAISSQTLADSNSGMMPIERIARRRERLCQIHLAVWLASSLCILTCFDWIRIVSLAWHRVAELAGRPWLDDVPLIVHIGVLLPVMCPLLLSWLCYYDAESKLDATLQTQSRWQYVALQARTFLLLPLAGIGFVAAWCETFEFFWPQFSESGWGVVARASPLLILVGTFPVLLRCVWQTRPLPDGTLRRGLERRVADVGFSVSEMLVWKTYRGSRNAAVAGFLPWPRYLLLTESLIDELSPRQIDYVLLHEVAHMKYRHSLKLLLVFGATLAAGFALVSQFAQRLNVLAAGIPSVGMLANVGQLVLLVVVLSVTLTLVGRHARLFELQSDLWAANTSGDRTTYLHTIAIIATGNPRQRTWLHPSFAERHDFLSKADAADKSLRYQLRGERLLLGFWICGLSACAVLLAWS